MLTRSGQYYSDGTSTTAEMLASYQAFDSRSTKSVQSIPLHRTDTSFLGANGKLIEGENATWGRQVNAAIFKQVYTRRK